MVDDEVFPRAQELVAAGDEYAGYFEARHWGQTRSEDHFWYYDALRRRTGLPAGPDVLEVGFGDGRFLDWCRARGLRPVGVEIQALAMAKAAALGHEVHMGPLTRSTFPADRKFQTIVCFDVLEHLAVHEIRQLLGITACHLSPDGRYLLRFPNGDSPFVGPIQSGDVTHRTLVSPGMIAEIARPFGLYVERALNDRLLPTRGAHRARRRIAYGLRSAIEAAIGLAYYGGIRPLDPNVFVILGPCPPSA